MDKRSMTCCFTGHRHLPPSDLSSIKTKLREKIIGLIEDGYLYFGVGGAIGFDTIAAEVLFELRENSPGIKVILVFPFAGFTDIWTDTQKARYEELLPLYDKVVCVSFKPSREAYLTRDRHLVNESSYCVAYCKKNSGGTAYTTRYAVTHGVEVYNVATGEILR